MLPHSHGDEERARRNAFRARSIALRFLDAFPVDAICEQLVQIRAGVKMTINYGLNKVRFPSGRSRRFAGAGARHTAFGGRRRDLWTPLFSCELRVRALGVNRPASLLVSRSGWFVITQHEPVLISSRFQRTAMTRAVGRGSSSAALRNARSASAPGRIGNKSAE